jgi:hypothetical protein
LIVAEFPGHRHGKGDRSMMLLPAIEFVGCAFNAIHRTAGLLHRSFCIAACGGRSSAPRVSSQPRPNGVVRQANWESALAGEDPPGVLTGRRGVGDTWDERLQVSPVDGPVWRRANPGLEQQPSGERPQAQVDAGEFPAARPIDHLSAGQVD